MAARDKFRQMIGRKAASDNLLAGDKRYIKIRTLGKGTYGIVLLAVDNKTRQKVSDSTCSMNAVTCGSLASSYSWRVP